MESIPTDRTESLRDAAIQGSAWTTAQVVVNKAAAAGATVVLGFLLTAEDFGVAWFAITAGQFLLVLPVVAMIDVLLASPGRIAQDAGQAQRIASRMGAVQAFVVVVGGIGLAAAFPDRKGLALLMAIVAVRPLMDAATVVPMSRMRIDLEYPVLAKIDCVGALLSSAGSVAMAALGAGSLAIVAPPIAAIGLRAFLYRRHCVNRPKDAAERPNHVGTALWRPFLWASLGSYVAAALGSIDLIAIGLVCETRELGIYAFAASLASQVALVIAFQAANAIQPIIGRLGHDPARQADGARRALALISAILVPLLLVQAAVGGPLIRTIWGSRWDDAVIVFQVITLAQAAAATQWPTAYILKAQGRFRTYLAIQGSCVVAAIATYPVVAEHPSWAVWVLDRMGIAVSSDASAGIAVAMVALAMATVSTPLAAWLALRACPVSFPRVIDLLWRPALVAVPITAVAGFVAEAAATQRLGSVFGSTVLVGIGLVSAAAAVAAGLCVRHSTRTDAVAVINRIRGRLFAP
jgi:O-antigen/teichoic acid export membrane protein